VDIVAGSQQIYFAEFLLDFLTMAPSSSVRVEVKYTFCDFIVIDTRDNFESLNHITSEASANKIVDLWNTLPQSVIDAKDVRQFEIRLDKYWEHQDVKFEYKASIQNKENTGNFNILSS
jgi:hypothetical protein